MRIAVIVLNGNNALTDTPYRCDGEVFFVRYVGVCVVRVSVVRQIAVYFSLTYEHLVILLSP